MLATFAPIINHAAHPTIVVLPHEIGLAVAVEIYDSPDLPAWIRLGPASEAARRSLARRS